MKVVANGNVQKFCELNGMEVIGEHRGNPDTYRGTCRVLVTDMELSLFEYHYLRYRMLRRGYTLISPHYGQDLISQFVDYLVSRERPERRGGRQPFGFVWAKTHREIEVHETEVARIVIGLRDRGASYREIVRYLSENGYTNRTGDQIKLNTVRMIIKNRDLYMEE